MPNTRFGRRGPYFAPVGARAGSRPSLWRDSGRWRQARFHLQWVMGWTNSHAHEFEVGKCVVAPDWWTKEVSTDSDDTVIRDERRVSVAAVFAEIGASGEFAYRYDMGDGWEHRIVFEPPSPAWKGTDPTLPLCVAAENACPPDDVGGPPGYARFLEALADPKHAQHEDMVRWIGGVFDPKGFDLNRLNRDYKGSKGRRR